MNFSYVRRALWASVLSVSVMAQHAVAQTVEPVPPGASAQTSADQQWQQELALWQAASSGNTPEEYRAYLRSYPNGRFADIARSRVSTAETARAPVAAAPPQEPQSAFMAGTPMTEDGLLDRTMRREVQGRLTSLGFPTGGADGAFGNQTRTALSRWQGTIGAPVTGYLNYDQFQRLRQDSQGVYETWLNRQVATRQRVVRRPDRVLEGRVPSNNNDDAAAALALGLIGGALIGGAIASGGRHHGGFRGGPGPGPRHGPGGCRPGMVCR